jgi:hypothetical protein
MQRRVTELRFRMTSFILYQVQAIFIGAVAVFVIVIAIIGPE